MVDRGLRRSFPRAVEEDARKRAGRRRAAIDLTALPTFTIDPVSARDFDDAISARREDGRVRLWVHIADVTAYMRPGTALEAEAYRRGTSVYVPGAVEPMLPRGALERGVQPRAAPGPQRGHGRARDGGGARRERCSFHRSVIRSDARLDYPQVDRIFAGEERAEEPWAEPLAAARAVAAALRRAPCAARLAGGRIRRAAVRVRRPRRRRGGPPGEADRVAHADRGADDPRQRAGGDAARRAAAPDALPRARAAGPRAGRAAGAAARVARRAHAAAARSR